jgi:hypothetical protein
VAATACRIPAQTSLQASVGAWGGRCAFVFDHFRTDSRVFGFKVRLSASYMPSGSRAHAPRPKRVITSPQKNWSYAMGMMSCGMPAPVCMCIYVCMYAESGQCNK